MDKREFTKWLEHHQQCLPSITNWLKSIRDPQALLDQWQTVLADVDLQDAIQATREIVAGHVERPYPDDTVGVVRRVAKQLAFNDHGYVEDFTGPRVCEICDGSGVVPVWHQLWVRSYRTGCTTWKHPGTGEVIDTKDRPSPQSMCACTCQRGDRYAIQRSARPGEPKPPEPLLRLGESPNLVRCRSTFEEDMRAEEF